MDYLQVERISNLLLIILLLYFVDNINAATTPKKPTISKHPIVIVVSFDGFRADYFGRVPTPALNELKAKGVRIPYLEPVFPTKTFPNHQSIATGVYVETHGIVSSSAYDPKYGIDKILKGKNAKPEFWNYHPEVLPLWIRNEQQGDGRVSGCLMWPGSTSPYGKENDLLPTHLFRGYDPIFSWNDRVDMVISWITNATAPANLVYLYFDEPDFRAHAFGPNAPETIQQIKEADKRTAYLVQKLKDGKLLEHVNLIMLSDHGMKEVSSSRIIPFSKLVDQNLIEIRAGSTTFLNLKAKEGKIKDLGTILEKLNNTNNLKVWRKEQLQNHHFHYSSSRRIFDFVVVADEGFAFEELEEKIAKYNQKWNLKADPKREYGDHGYDNLLSSMRAYFIGHGPAFKKNTDHPVIKNIDLFSLISKISGLPKFANNGSFDRVKDMLN